MSTMQAKLQKNQKKNKNNTNSKLTSRESIKRAMSILLVAIMMVSTISPLALASSTAITVEDFKSSDSSITEGESFDLELELKNNTDQAIEDVYLKVDSGSAFSLDGRGSKEKITDSIPANSTKKVEIKLEYDGSDSEKFGFELLYGDQSTSDYIKLPVKIEKEEEETDEDDEDEIAKLVMGDAPDKDTVEPGDSARISITLENTGDLDAKDIKITPVVTEGDIEIDDYEDEIDKIRDGKDEEVSFRFDVDKKAENGTYKIGFQVRYEDKEDNKYTDNDTFYGYIKVEGSDEKPEIIPDSIAIQGNTLKAGQPSLVFIDFQNVTERTAEEVRIRLKGYTPDGIRLHKDAPLKELGDIAPGEKGSTGYVLMADEAMKSGTYELTAQIEYKDDRGEKYEVEEPVFITVEEKDFSQIGLKFANVVYPKGKLATNKNFSISFDVVNQGAMTAEDVEVKINDSNGKMIYRSNPEFRFDEIPAGTKKSVKFDMMVPKNMDSNFYPLYAEMTYDKGGETSKPISQPVGFYVDGEGSSENSIPKIIIKDYDLGGDNKILAGSETEVTLVFENTSSDSVKNVKVSLEAEEGVFTFVDMASSFYIKSIPAKGTASKTLKMKTKNDASVKSYKLTTKLQYENSKGISYDENDNPFESDEFINIPVRQKFRLETGDIELPREAKVGETEYLLLPFYNMGKAKMFNLMVNVEGEFATEDANMFVGDFDAGQSEDFEAGIIPEAEGPVEGKVVFTYEDADGNVSTKEVPFSYQAMPAEEEEPIDMDMGEGEMGQFGEGEMPGMEGESGSSKTLWIVLGVVVVAGIAGFVIYKKKKKAKALEEEFEDEE